MVPKITPSTHLNHVAVASPLSNDLRAFGIAPPNNTMAESVSNRYTVNLTKKGGLEFSSTWADKLSKRGYEPGVVVK